MPSTAAAKTEATELKTAAFDSRFPHQNQTRNCWQNYVDYYRCLKIKGEKYSLCDYFKQTFTVLCPSEWVSQWDEQRENGSFTGRI